MKLKIEKNMVTDVEALESLLELGFELDQDFMNDFKENIMELTEDEFIAKLEHIKELAVPVLEKQLEDVKRERKDLSKFINKAWLNLTSKDKEIFNIASQMLEYPYVRELGLDLEDCMILVSKFSDEEINSFNKSNPKEKGNFIKELDSKFWGKDK